MYRGTEIASPRPRQGQAKAKPRPRQGLVKASSRPSQGRAKAAPRCYTEKTDYRRPQRVPPELILELLGAILVDF